MTHDHRTWFGRIIDALTPGPYGAPGDYANGGGKLYTDEPAPLGKTRPYVGTPSAPRPRRPLPTPPRSWKLYEGHGYFIGTAIEDPDSKTVRVRWERNAITKPPVRLQWVDIEALRDDARDHAFFRYVAPIRIRPVNHDDIEGL